MFYIKLITITEIMQLRWRNIVLWQCQAPESNP